MYSIAYKIIESSIVGTLVCLLLLLLQPFTMRIFSKRWNYYMSLVPIVFFLGGSKIITPFVQFINLSIPEKLEATFKFSNDFHNKEYATIFSGSIISFDTEIKYNSFVTYVLLMWIIGIIIFIFFRVKNYFEFRFNVMNTCISLPNDFCSIKIIKSSYATTPMLFGILKPLIVLPYVNINDQELELIIKHELIHCKRKDLVIKWIVMISSAIHWFNPIIFKMERNIDVLCETSCDEMLISNMDFSERKLYGKTILSMLEYGVTKQIGLFTGLCNTKKNIEGRLINIMEFKKVTSTGFIFSLIVSILVIGVGGTIANAMPNGYQVETKPLENNNLEWVKFAENIDSDPAIPNENIPIYGQEGNIPEYPEWIKFAEDVASDLAVPNQNITIYEY